MMASNHSPTQLLITFIALPFAYLLITLIPFVNKAYFNHTLATLLNTRASNTPLGLSYRFVSHLYEIEAEHMGMP